MNIATTTERPAFATQAPLRDKVALVTGSTSGIGLGIARALAAAGAAIVLNGFGKQDEIEATQQAIGADLLVAGSVHLTASHPQGEVLGWDGFKALADRANLPVYAIGGVGPGHIREAFAHYAQGVAGISAYWAY